MSNENNETKTASNFWTKIRRYFIAGVLITAPISITLLLAWEFIELIDATVDAVIPHKYHPEEYLPFSVPGFGLIIVFLYLNAHRCFYSRYGRAFMATCLRKRSRAYACNSFNLQCFKADF